MNGKYLLDTNAIINLLKRDNITGLKNLKGSFFVSFITELELLSYKHITKVEEKNIKNLLKASGVININDKIKKETIKLKRKHGLKLPDAIIIATAIVWDFALITDDQKLHNINEIEVLSLEELLR